MLRKSAISLAIMSALAPMQANALGLGEMTVSSALNQPLQAEINLLQLRGLNVSQVVTRFAQTDDFYLAGVKPSPILSDIRFKLDIKGGQGKIVLTSSAPIREPFLNFLIEVNWPSGRLVREYTVLLDPPVFTAEDLAPRGQPVVPVVKAAKAGLDQPSSSRSPVAQASVSVPSSVSPPSRYSVTRADTLWQVALNVRPDSSISPQQMMLALQRMNPDAFINNNINRLKSGVVLDVPTKEQILNIKVSESLQEVKRQNNRWKAVPATADTSKAAKLDVAPQEMSSASAAVTEDAQLRIVSNGADEAATAAEQPATVARETTSVAMEPSLVAEISAKNDELEEQLVITLEGLNKVERDNIEMFDRLDRLSEQMASMQRLVELKDLQLAELQGRLAQQSAEPVVEQSAISRLPFEWLAGGAAALLAGLLLWMRKRKQQDVKEVLEPLAGGDAAVAASVASAASLAAVEPVVAATALDQLKDTPVEERLVKKDVDAPLHMSTENRGPVDEFDAISDDELESALGEDLDMDLKLDGPVVDDSEMSAFSSSLLDEYDLATGFDDDKDTEMSAAMEADSDVGADFDALLAEHDFDDSEVDLAAEEGADEIAFAAARAGSEDDFDSDLDALLADGGLAEQKSDEKEEPLVELDDGLEDGFGSELDDLLVDEDGFAPDQDQRLVDEGAADPLLDDEDSIDEMLERLLEDYSKDAESSGIERVGLAVDDDDIPGDEVLDALLAKAGEHAGTAESSAIELEELASEGLADSEAKAEFADQAGSEVTDDAFVFELDDDGDLDTLLPEIEAGDSTNSTRRSTLSLEDDLDQADEAELEAELEQMLVSESNDLALQEADFDDDEVGYLDEADEVGTKIDLARAYIDMEDQEGASDILQEVVAEGSAEQVAEAKQLLESLKR